MPQPQSSADIKETSTPNQISIPMNDLPAFQKRRLRKHWRKMVETRGRNKLCCILNMYAKCRFCGLKQCVDCAGNRINWGERNNFVCYLCTQFINKSITPIDCDKL